MSRNFDERSTGSRSRGLSGKSRQSQAAPKSPASSAWPPTSAPAKPPAPTAEKTPPPTEKPAKTTVVTAEAPAPTQEQIAERARAIWIASGCLPGRDEENWLEAERQLRAEMASR